MKLRHSIIAAAALAACVVLGAQAQTSPAMADSAAKQPSGERTLANQDKGMPKSTASSTTRKEVKAQAVSARADGQVAVGEQSTPNQGKKPMKAKPSEVSRADVKADAKAANKARTTPVGELTTNDQGKGVTKP